MKTVTTENTRSHTGASRGAAALLLAATLAAMSNTAGAAQAPTAAELEDCLHRAGLELTMDAKDLHLSGAQKFALGRERHLIALDTAIALGGPGSTGVTPRLYCTVERDGGISKLQSMPRLPLRPDAGLVAK